EGSPRAGTAAISSRTEASASSHSPYRRAASRSTARRNARDTYADVDNPARRAAVFTCSGRSASSVYETVAVAMLQTIPAVLALPIASTFSATIADAARQAGSGGPGRWRPGLRRRRPPQPRQGAFPRRPVDSHRRARGGAPPGLHYEAARRAR